MRFIFLISSIRKLVAYRSHMATEEKQMPISAHVRHLRQVTKSHSGDASSSPVTKRMTGLGMETVLKCVQLNEVKHTPRN